MINLIGYSVLVDNEEQAKKLQEIAFEQGFEWKYLGKNVSNLDERSFQFGYGDEKIITISISRRHYQDKHITKKAHFNDLFNTLEQCNMKLTKENVYINLKGKTKEELNEIVNFLESIKEKTEQYIRKEIHRQNTLEFYNGEWLTDDSAGDKQEVTIAQLKEILQPVDTLEQKLQKAKAEVARLEKLINAKNELKRIQKLIESLENESKN